MISQDLLTTYTYTTFIVHTEQGDIPIRVGKVHPMIDELIADESIREWAFITAYNPGSEVLSKEENKERQKELKKKVIVLGLSFMDGIGISDDGKWEDTSIFIPGISLEDAKQLGKMFEQNAIVYGKIGEEAQLVVCN